MCASVKNPPCTIPQLCLCTSQHLLRHGVIPSTFPGAVQVLNQPRLPQGTRRADASCGGAIGSRERLGTRLSRQGSPRAPRDCCRAVCPPQGSAVTILTALLTGRQPCRTGKAQGEGVCSLGELDSRCSRLIAPQSSHLTWSPCFEEKTPHDNLLIQSALDRIAS